MPESWKEAINRLIDERVEEKVKVLEQHFQEAIAKLGTANNAGSTKKLPVKAVSEARNGNSKHE